MKRLANKDIILDDVIKESIKLTVKLYEEMLPEIKLNEIEKNTLRNTIYYVDVQNALCIKGVPFITCDIYEDEFSNHLIAQVGLEDDEENDILPSAEELKNKKIVCFIQLDEHIMR